MGFCVYDICISIVVVDDATYGKIFQERSRAYFLIIIKGGLLVG
jgi:hypothetical protein